MARPQNSGRVPNNSVLPVNSPEKPFVHPIRYFADSMNELQKGHAAPAAGPPMPAAERPWQVGRALRGGRYASGRATVWLP